MLKKCVFIFIVCLGSSSWSQTFMEESPEYDFYWLIFSAEYQYKPQEKKLQQTSHDYKVTNNEIAQARQLSFLLGNLHAYAGSPFIYDQQPDCKPGKFIDSETFSQTCRYKIRIALHKTVLPPVLMPLYLPLNVNREKINAMYSTFESECASHENEWIQDSMADPLLWAWIRPLKQNCRISQFNAVELKEHNLIKVKGVLEPIPAVEKAQPQYDKIWQDHQLALFITLTRYNWKTVAEGEDLLDKNILPDLINELKKVFADRINEKEIINDQLHFISLGEGVKVLKLHLSLTDQKTIELTVLVLNDDEQLEGNTIASQKARAIYQEASAKADFIMDSGHAKDFGGDFTTIDNFSSWHTTSPHYQLIVARGCSTSLWLGAKSNFWLKKRAYTWANTLQQPIHQFNERYYTDMVTHMVDSYAISTVPTIGIWLKALLNAQESYAEILSQYQQAWFINNHKAVVVSGGR